MNVIVRATAWTKTHSHSDPGPRRTTWSRLITERLLTLGTPRPLSGPRRCSSKGGSAPFRRGPTAARSRRRGVDSARAEVQGANRQKRKDRRHGGPVALRAEAWWATLGSNQ